MTTRYQSIMNIHNIDLFVIQFCHMKHVKKTMHRNKKLEESFEYNASWFKSLLPHPLRTRAWSFIWTTLNTHHTRMLCAKLYDIVLMVLEKKIFKCLKLFLPLSPFGRGRYPLFEHTWIPIISKSALCQIWLKLAQWFWRKLSIFSMLLLYPL